MALARNFVATTSNPNEVALTWDQPLDFNNTTSELIVTKTDSYFPVELYNASFPTKATDSRPIEIFRGGVIGGFTPGTITITGNILTDTAANFPLNPNLIGRLLRDSDSNVYRILANTLKTITVDPVHTIINGKYVILADFPSVIRSQENYEIDIRTEVGAGFIKNLIVSSNGQLLQKIFGEEELANSIFVDGAGNKYFIKSNTLDTLYFFETATPVIGVGMATLSNFANGATIPYSDTLRTESEAAARVGNGLQDDTFNYYTIFTKPTGANVAQAEFSIIGSGAPTQAYALSTKDTKFGDLLFNLWPEVHKGMDSTGDLNYLMQIFGFQFNELYSLIKTYNLQNADKVLVTALQPLSEQTGLPSVGLTIGADTLRRIARNLIYCWHLKGSKEGIALFIKMITTWDITAGTADYSNAIQDTLPNIAALRFFDANLGSTNTRLTETSPTIVSGGRFAKALPGIIIPGFFSFREFVITLPEVALFVGYTQNFTTAPNLTTMVDNLANFGAVNSLVGNFLLSNQSEIDDIYQIVGNTATTITVKGLITNKNPGDKYAVLSPLNSNRLSILNKLMPYYIPYLTKQSYDFT